MAIKIPDNLEHPQLPPECSGWAESPEYQVRRGDRFWRYSRRFNGTPALHTMETVGGYEGYSFQRLNEEDYIVFVAQLKREKNKPINVGRFIETRPFPHGY